MPVAKVKRSYPAPDRLIVNEIQQISVDRTPKDIADLRQGLRSAESIAYPNRTKLYDLYADVWLDGYLTGVWEKRESAAANKEVKFLDASGNEVKQLNDLIDSHEFERLKCLILQSKLWGISGVEFIPGRDFAFKVVPRKHIKPELGVIAINQSDYTGVPYLANPNIWVVGSDRDLGLLLKCSFYALIKKGNFADWAQYSEIFGQPIRVAKYDAYDDKTRIQLKEVLQDAGSSLAIMIPRQAEFEIMDGKTSNGDGQLQERLKNACNTEMGIIILGNTETTSNDNGGSHAKAKEQGKQQLEITKKDIKFLQSQLNDEKFLKVLEEYGYPVSGGKFVVNDEPDPYQVLAQMQVAQIAKTMGTPVGDDYIYDLTRIPKPNDYNQQKADQEKQALPAPPPERREKGTDDGGDEGAQDLSDNIVRRVRSKLADFFDLAP